MKPLYCGMVVFLLITTNLLGQEIEFKNTAEISLFNSGKQINSRGSDFFYFIGLSANYKRLVYSDKINNLAIGLSIQHSNSAINISGPYDDSGSIRYYLSHKITSPGIILSDYVSFKRKKIGFFFEVALSAKYHFTSNPYRDLTYFPYTIELTNPFGNKNDEILNELSINRIGFYGAVQVGVEFNLFKNTATYLAYSIGTNINSHYKETLVASTLLKIENYYFYYSLFSLGFRF